MSGNVDNGFAPVYLMLGESLEHKKTLLGVGEFSNPFLGGGTFTRPGLPLVKIFVNQPKLLLLLKWNAMRFFPNQRMLLPNWEPNLLLGDLILGCEINLLFPLLS
jgi:hypothetical protein